MPTLLWSVNRWWHIAIAVLFMFMALDGTRVVGRVVDYDKYNRDLADVRFPTGLDQFTVASRSPVPTLRNASTMLVNFPQTSYYAASEVQLAPLKVTLADDNGVPLSRGFPATVRVQLIEVLPEPYSSTPSRRRQIRPVSEGSVDSTLQIERHRQHVQFAGLQLKSPPAGKHQLEVVVSQHNFTRSSMRQVIPFAVFPGLRPTNISFVRSVARSFTPFGPFSQQPVVALLDAVGNLVPAATGSIRVTAAGPSSQSSAGLTLEEPEVPVVNGMASWSRMRLRGITPGRGYVLNFTFVPTGESHGVDWVAPQHNVETLSARCNSSCSAALCGFQPQRVIRGNGLMRIFVSGWPYLQHASRATLCRLATEPPLPGKIRIHDECNAECVLNVSQVPSSSTTDPTRRFTLQTSVDGGATYANLTKVVRVKEDCDTTSNIAFESKRVGDPLTEFGTVALLETRPNGLHVNFEDRTPRLTANLRLDPYGNTRLGNVTVEVVDAWGNAFRELDAGTWKVWVGSPRDVPLDGTLTQYSRRGAATFPDLSLPGFYEAGKNVTLSFFASRQATNDANRVTRIDDGRLALTERTGRYLRTTLTFFLVTDYETRCTVPPVIDSVGSDGCTEQRGELGVAGCTSSSPISVTVTGRGFGVSGARVRLGSVVCTDTQHDRVSPLTRLIATCNVPPVNPTSAKGDVVTAVNGVATTVILRAGIYTTSKVARVRPNVPVTVDQVTGCPWALVPSTGDCSSTEATTITVAGSNFGTSNASVELVSYYSGASFECKSVVHDSASPSTVVTCQLPPARGVAYLAAVTNGITRQRGVATHAAVTFRNRSTALCPKNLAGQLCSGHGTCDFTKLECSCFSDDDLGYWTGAACDSCVASFWGSKCAGRCLDCVANRGSCNEGRTGDGTCACITGFGGATCEVECPGGQGNPCSGHGICSPLTGACACNATDAVGYWAVPDCASCDLAYGGESCDIACPRDPSLNAVCGGHGACNSQGACDCLTGFCNVACNTSGVSCTGCPAGVWGLTCGEECLGGRTTPCSNHGNCSDGPFGTGRCICEEGYGGSACDLVCPPSIENPCSGHGSCTQATGKCGCSPGWSLDDCSAQCPGGAANPCNGRGKCNQTTSTCTCNFGYAGASCELECTGGASRPCNFHGTCQTADGSCVCYNNTNDGFWRGTTCDQCQAEWFTGTCDKQCNYANGAQCNGHGSCDHNLQCTCFSGSTTGYWEGENCTSCKSGFWGAQCLLDCPGTACSPCNFHGNCSDDIGGTGQCTCELNHVNGFWVGATCNQCAPGYYAFDCLSQCPQGTGLATGTCGGRGACDDGTSGTGRCTCSGTFGGTSCSECVTGFWGVGCSNECPGGSSNPCFGFGICNSTELSSGECVCEFGRVGSSCELACPATSRGPCNFAGECKLNDDGTAGICDNCTQTATGGFWQGSVCDDCSAGYFGSLCRNECPGGISDVCSGHGLCRDGVNGTGACTCFNGYAGVSCAIECLGGAQRPCNNRGTCDANTGACACHSSAALGFWSGTPSCSACTPTFAGSTCSVQCPLDGSGNPCSNQGVCYEGVCIYCNATQCGQTCELNVATATCTVCPRGRFGSSCQECPGGAGSPCSGHGTCHEGFYGSGRCYCDTGYLGGSCSERCNGPPGVPCNGNGECSLVDGSCTCRSGFAGPACATLCNGFTNTLGSVPCSGVGTCDANDGTCTCDSGYGGTSCQIECPGGVSNPCNGNGVCTVFGNCTCFQTLGTGFWGGSACARCSQGYFGSTCKRPCVNGRSNALFTGCVCSDGWYGEQCDVPCVGLLEVGSQCYGHGNCSDGVSGDGSCSCVAEYYTASCNVSCTRDRCNSELTNGQCDNQGVCECRDDAEQHWIPGVSGQCDTCNISYFGENCETSCPCNGHGLCDRRTGSCTCYSEDSLGYWGGKLCEECSEGFIGVRCQGRDVAISRSGALSSSINNPYPRITAGVLCYDSVTNFTYMGLEIISVFNRQQVLVRSFDVRGLAVACHFPTAAEMYLFVYTNTTARFAVIDRASATFSRFVDVVNVVNQGAQVAGRLNRHFAAESSRTSAEVSPAEQYLTTFYPELAAAVHHEALRQANVGTIIQELAQAMAVDREQRLPESMRFPDAAVSSQSGPGTARRLQQATLVTNSTANTVDAATYVAHGVIQPITLGDHQSSPMAIAFFGGLVLIVPTDGLNPYAVATGLTRVSALSRDAEDLLAPAATSWAGTFLIAGTTATGAWEIVRIRIDGLTPSVEETLAATYNSQVAQECGGCTVAAVAAGFNGTVYAAMTSQSQAFIARMGTLYAELPDGTPTVSATNFSMRLTLDTTANVTAMTIDNYATQGYVAMNAPNSPSILFKFDLESCTVSGENRLSIVGADREIAMALRLVPEYRILQLYAPLSLLLRTIELATFAVVSVRPEFADTQGGTPITITGTGLIAGMNCDFGTEDRRVEGSFFDRSKLVCTAPSGGSEACSGEGLELSIQTPSTWKRTNNKLTVRRVTTPIVRSIRSNETGGNFGFITGGHVEVQGVGFAECVGCVEPLLKCRVSSPRSSRSPIIVLATPVSSNEVRCQLPGLDAPLPIPTYLEVSVDGTVFSNSQRTYATFGSDAGIVATFPALPSGVANSTVVDPATDPSRFPVKSSFSTPLPYIVVDVTDAEVHSLGSFAQTVGQHDIRVSLYAVRSLDGNITVLDTAEYVTMNDTAATIPTAGPGMNGTLAPVAVGEQSVSVANMGSGGTIELYGTLGLHDATNASVTFTDLRLVNAPVGLLTLRFADSGFGWSTFLTLSITEGEPHRLFFQRRPSTTSKNSQPTLATQPIIGVLDLSGNLLSSLDGKETVVDILLVNYGYHQLGDGLPSEISRAFQPVGNLFRIEGLTLTGRRGIDYVMNFTAPGLAEPTLLSDPISIDNCPENQFGRFNSTECFECPVEGTCDGSLVIRARDNWWRADNTTLNFYYCGAPNSGDSCFNDSKCVVGYRGPMCSLCDDGFGTAGIRCSKCVQGNEALIVVLCVVIVGVFVLLVFTVMTGSARNLMAVVFRNLVTHMQILSRLGELQVEWPSLLATLWEIMNKVQVEPTGISPIDCATKVNYFTKYIGVMISPWALVLVVAPIAFIFVQIRQRRQDQPIEAAIEKVQTTLDDGDETEVLFELALLTFEEKQLHREQQRNRKAKKLARKGKRRSTIGGAAGTGTAVTHTSTIDDDDDDPTTDLTFEDTEVTATATATGFGTSTGVPDVLSRRKPAGDDTTTGHGHSDNETEGIRRLRGRAMKAAARPSRDVALKPLLFVQDVMRHRAQRSALLSTFIVTGLVTFTLLYPTLVQSSGIILKCERIDMGMLGFRDLFVRDRTVDCSSSQYQIYYTVAVSVLVLYGFCVPAAVVATTILVRQFGGQLRARTLLSFLLHGFKPELWFWETTNLLRKFAVMLIVVFVKDAKLQVIIFMWSVVTSFMMHLLFRPYTDNRVHRVEAIGQSCMVVTLNFVLLLFLPSVSASSWQPFALSVVVLVINVIAMLVYLWAMGYYLYKSVQHYRERQRAIAECGGKHPAIVALDTVIAELEIARLEKEELKAELMRIMASRRRAAGGLEGSFVGLDDDASEDETDADALDPAKYRRRGSKTRANSAGQGIGSFVAFGGPSPRGSVAPLSTTSLGDAALVGGADVGGADVGSPLVVHFSPPTGKTPPGSPLMSPSGAKASFNNTSFARRSVTFDTTPKQTAIVKPVSSLRRSADDSTEANRLPGDDSDFMFNLPDGGDFSPIVKPDRGGTGLSSAFTVPSTDATQPLKRDRSGGRSSPTSRALLLKAFGPDSDDDDDGVNPLVMPSGVLSPTPSAALPTHTEPQQLTQASLMSHTRAEEERALRGSGSDNSTGDTDDLIAAVARPRRVQTGPVARANRNVGRWNTDHVANFSPVPSPEIRSAASDASAGSFDSRPPSAVDTDAIPIAKIPMPANNGRESGGSEIRFGERSATPTGLRGGGGSGAHEAGPGAVFMQPSGAIEADGLMLNIDTLLPESMAVGATAPARKGRKVAQRLAVRSSVQPVAPQRMTMPFEHPVTPEHPELAVDITLDAPAASHHEAIDPTGSNRRPPLARRPPARARAAAAMDGADFGITDSWAAPDEPAAGLNLADLLGRIDDSTPDHDADASPSPREPDDSAADPAGVAPHVRRVHRRPSANDPLIKPTPGRGPRNPLDPDGGILSDTSTSRDTPRESQARVRASFAPDESAGSDIVPKTPRVVTASAGQTDSTGHDDPAQELADMRFSFGDLGGVGESGGDHNAVDDPFAGFELPAPVNVEAKSASGSGADPSAALRGLDFARAAGVEASHSTSLGLKPALKRGSFADSSGVMKTSSGQAQSFSGEPTLDDASFGRSAPRRATAVSFVAPGEDDDGAATADGMPAAELPAPPARPDRTPSAFSSSPASMNMSPAALKASPQQATVRVSGFRRGTAGVASVPKVPTPAATPTRTQSSDRMAQSARKPTAREATAAAAEAGASLTPRTDRTARERARADRDARRAAATRQRRAQSVGGLGTPPSMFDDVNEDGDGM